MTNFNIPGNVTVQLGQKARLNWLCNISPFPVSEINHAMFVLVQDTFIQFVLTYDPDSQSLGLYPNQKGFEPICDQALNDVEFRQLISESLIDDLMELAKLVQFPYGRTFQG